MEVKWKPLYSNKIVFAKRVCEQNKQAGGSRLSFSKLNPEILRYIKHLHHTNQIPKLENKSW